MTKDDAEKVRLNNISARVLDFCPLINGTCNTKCVCYAEFRVDESGSIVRGNKIYYVIGGYCNNSMFHRE